ncbi:hypothetical protein [Spirosoma foliorum]|uniref:Outer membrane protein beta-barrel domain-containing protein n=1 Tax=Spirosoma foliorum TaxID=2710596 RepID=A0A7G5H2V4_9BACT|nr:hypothetical protein [Spirosoma foliorum]QMW05446.1 hypothetical protein H3H32_11415 [Spirosoma foliorum]
MNKLILIWFCLCIGTKTLFAQQGKYDIAVSYGFYQAPMYKQAVNKNFFAADFDYYIAKRWAISSGFLSGQFAYYEDYRSNAYSNDDYTNAKGYESHAYLTASYSVIHGKRFSVQIGAGIGLFTQRLKFPYRAAGANLEASHYGEQIFTGEESFSIVEIPLKLEAYYRLGTRFGLGIKAGTFLQLGRPLAASYFGPQLRVRL